MRMKPRACIFDLDGTLLDTLHDLADAANAALAADGHPVHPVDAYRQFVGDGIETLLRRALPDEHSDEDVARGVERMREIYAAGWSVRTAPYEGIHPLLSALRERRLPLAVLSNKPHPFTVEMVHHYFGDAVFAQIAGAKPDVHRKPHPEAALRMAAAWGLEPCDVAFIGDSDVDIRTAKAAGMFAVGCSWGFRGPAELRKAGAELLLDVPADLMRLIGD